MDPSPKHTREPDLPVDESSRTSGNMKEGHSDISSSDFEVEVAANALSLRGFWLKVSLTLVAGTGFTLFGYDAGVMSALLTAGQFEKVFPQVIVEASHPNHATLQSFVGAIYSGGCLFGALLTSWIGDWLGRRRTIVLGGTILIIGAILQTASYSYAQLVVARIVTGFGNGVTTSTVPTYHAECSPAGQRGSFIMIEGSLLTLGVAASHAYDLTVLYGQSDSSAQWRVPESIQIVFALVVVIWIVFLPESPRWLMKHGREAQAMAIISAFEDKPSSDPGVQLTFHAMREAVAKEGSILPRGDSKSPEDKATTGRRRGNATFKEIFTGGRSQNFRRVALGSVAQIFQQITGIAVVIFYAAILFQTLGLSDVTSRLVAGCMGTQYFLFSLTAIPLIDRVGRRPLMLACAGGLCITMLLLAVLGSIGSKIANTVSVVLVFIYLDIFSLGWLGMTWLYPAEIAGLRVRAYATSLATASNWTFNFIIIMVTGPAFQNIGWKTYIAFAVLNAFMVPCVYFFFPETAGRSLEDLDVVFALAYIEGVSPVSVSLRKDVPLAGTPEADRILGIECSSVEKVAI
ncbi:hypothetical protein SERLADRAFT_436811 [Serpula lacrymans var. lacrymans S7.9]|uniref:Major facilitator superfamily (MFS) profile domain-containing protein n=1 Tax=Serpula lacrymans var. lacrymans (strain S7.9) TaxID=578457 RepID=F8NSR4_SERL9|nr:uncharacterized protein SERLADRAFT_436811 [Serpula lacrymans var. lacrymans S7.9]EGO26988.1 hypothetical protein SERLADRAFT_436811 [Serpula lacrymans var. lacrymans S7.9]